MSEYFLPVIFCIGFMVSFVTSIAGGGGLIALPAFMALGIPPINALAMNKLTDVGVILGAGKNYVDLKKIDWKLWLKAMPIVLFGHLMGALLIVHVIEPYLKQFIYGSLFFGGFFLAIFFIKKSFRESVENPSSIRQFIGRIGLFSQGFWDGAFAIAGATLGLIFYTKFMGKKFMEARSTEVIVSAPGFLLSSFILVSESALHTSHIITLILAGALGSYAGSSYMLHLSKSQSDGI